MKYLYAFWLLYALSVQEAITNKVNGVIKVIDMFCKPFIMKCSTLTVNAFVEVC